MLGQHQSVPADGHKAGVAAQPEVVLAALCCNPAAVQLVVVVHSAVETVDA